MTAPRRTARVAGFARDRRGSSAVEFSLIAMPFIMLLLALPQMALYYMTQSSLDAGVIQAADTLVNGYYAGTAPAAMTSTTLRALVVSKSGGLVKNTSALLVDLRELSALDAAAVPITNTVDSNAPRDVLALRAQVTVPSVVPLIGALVVRSSAVVRRQAL